MSASSESATWATISRLRSGSPRFGRGDAWFLSAGTRSAPKAWRAGASPKSRLVSSEITRVKRRTRALSPKSSAVSVKKGGRKRQRKRGPKTASSAPTAPPSRPRTTLSVRSCWNRRPRPTPSASRTAISLRRPRPRLSSRLETLEQAISSSSPTTAVSRMPART